MRSPVNMEVKLSPIYIQSNTNVYVVNGIKINIVGVIQNVLLGNMETTVCRTAVRIVPQQRLVTEKLVSVTKAVLQDGNYLFVMKVHAFFFKCIYYLQLLSSFYYDFILTLIHLNISFSINFQSLIFTQLLIHLISNLLMICLRLSTFWLIKATTTKNNKKKNQKQENSAKIVDKHVIIY